MSTFQLTPENLTTMGYQSDTAFLIANNFNGFNNNLTFDFDDSNYNLIIDNLSKALNISPANLSHYVNDSTMQSSEHSYREALTVISIITVFYTIIFVSGIIGNLITCIVISRNKYMHTATNFYLFNLAISDLLLLLSGLPQEIYSLWHPRSYPFTDVVCILESTLLETAANVTVLTITAFSVERYIAICHPFRQHSMSKLSRAIKFILAIWVTAFILALPQAMQFAVIAEKGSISCTLKNLFYGHVFAVSGCVFFVGPMTAICVLYVLIGIKLKKSKLLQGVKRYDRGISAQTRVIRMLVAVAVAFFLCWAPFHAQRLMAVYGSTVKYPSKLFKKVFPVLNHVSGVMYFLSTCINPLLYNIMSHKFRNAFKLTLARQCGLFRSYQTKNSNYYSALPRQNGSMRLNMSTLDHRTTVMQLNKRESDLSLLQDNNTNNSRRLSMRSGTMGNHYRCVSVSSQSTLMTTLSKNDVYSTVANVTPNRNHHIINNYCNSNSSSNYSNNRHLNSSIQESNNTSYGNNNNNNSCSPTTQLPGDMQISSIDDNLDEIADCHRLKNVQRYQQSGNIGNAATITLNNPLKFTSSTENSTNNNKEHYNQLPSFSTIAMSGSSHNSKPTVSVIVPSKKFKSSSLGGNSTGFRKSYEAHPNSMMALNNGTNQTALFNSNFKELINDYSHPQNLHHHHHHHRHHQNHHHHRGKRYKKDYDNAMTRKTNKNSNNSVLIIGDSDTLTDNSSNLSSSCSCSSNSSCGDTKKCDKFSFSSSNIQQSSQQEQQQKLNNEISDLNRLSQLKQNDDSVAINRIQNILIDNNLTKSNSHNSITTAPTTTPPITTDSQINNKNIILNKIIHQNQNPTEIILTQLLETPENNVVVLNNENDSILNNTTTIPELKERIPSSTNKTNNNSNNKNNSSNNSNDNSNKYKIINKDNNSDLLNTMNVNLNINKIDEIDEKNQKTCDEYNDIQNPNLTITKSDSNGKLNILESTVKIPAAVTTVVTTTVIPVVTTQITTINSIPKNKKQKR